MFGKTRIGKAIALANLRALETDPRTVRIELTNQADDDGVSASRAEPRRGMS